MQGSVPQQQPSHSQHCSKSMSRLLVAEEEEMLDCEVASGSVATRQQNTSTASSESEMLDGLGHEDHTLQCHFKECATAGDTASNEAGIREETATSDLAIYRIEAMLADAAKSISCNDNSLSLRLRKRPSDPYSHPTTSVLPHEAQANSVREIRFPGKSPDEAWLFTVVLRLLELIHEALRNDTVVTKRDLFYRDPALFGKQAIVDSYVDTIARTIAMPRAALNVVAGAKGLLAGNIVIVREDGTILSGARDGEGILVPNLSDQDKIDLSFVKWILVIEKEAVFKYLLSSAVKETILREGVILTAKGYPDISSRTLLSLITKQIATQRLAVTIFALVDFDPDGLGILSTYKHGSATLAHETAALALPSMTWLGIHSHHLGADEEGLHQIQGLLPLSTRDRKKATQMLRWKHMQEDGSEGFWRKELQIMLMLNLKAEIQILDAGVSGIEDWLTTTMASY